MNINIYRYYNMDKSDYGAPFYVCEEHYEEIKRPDNCVLDKLGTAEKGTLCCICTDEKP